MKKWGIAIIEGMIMVAIISAAVLGFHALYEASGIYWKTRVEQDAVTYALIGCAVMAGLLVIKEEVISLLSVIRAFRLSKRVK